MCVCVSDVWLMPDLRTEEENEVAGQTVELWSAGGGV